MDTNLTNPIMMQKTVAAYMDSNTAIWSPMAPMQTAMQTFKQNLVVIDDAAQKQQTPSGATEDKAAARDSRRRTPRGRFKFAMRIRFVFAKQ